MRAEGVRSVEYPWFGASRGSWAIGPPTGGREGGSRCLPAKDIKTRGVGGGIAAEEDGIASFTAGGLGRCEVRSHGWKHSPRHCRCALWVLWWLASPKAEPAGLL